MRGDTEAKQLSKMDQSSSSPRPTSDSVGTSSSDSPLCQKELKIRIANIDWYMDTPLLKGCESDMESVPYISHVQQKLCPIIRVFGATNRGGKCCVHIHGVRGGTMAVLLFWGDHFNFFFFFF